MKDMGEVIKLLALNASEASKPVDVVEGKVEQIEPTLLVRIGERLTLTAGSIVFLRGVTYELDTRLLFIRAKGGQKYYAIGVI